MRPFALASTVLAAALLTGCGHSAPTRFFSLDALPPAAAAQSYGGPPFRVDAVHVPMAMDRTEVVTVSGADRLAVDDLDHWGAPVGQLARRALTQDLAARLPAGLVIYPDAPKPAGAGGVVVDVLALQRIAEGYVMDVSWTLQGVGPNATAMTRTLRLTDADPAGADPSSDEAAAFSRLLAQLADRMSQDLAAQR